MFRPTRRGYIYFKLYPIYLCWPYPILYCCRQFHCFVPADINRPFTIHKTWIKTSELQASLVSHFQQKTQVQALMSTRIPPILDYPIEPYFPYSNSKFLNVLQEFLTQFNLLSHQKLYGQSLPTNDLETNLSIRKIIEFTAFYYRKPFSIYELADLMHQSPLSVCRFLKSNVDNPTYIFLGPSDWNRPDV